MRHDVADADGYISYERLVVYAGIMTSGKLAVVSRTSRLVNALPKS